MTSFDTFISCSYVTWHTPAATSDAQGVNITLGTLINFTMRSGVLQITVAVITSYDLDTRATIMAGVRMTIVLRLYSYFSFAAWSSESRLTNACWRIPSRLTDSTIHTVTWCANLLFTMGSCESVRTLAHVRRVSVDRRTSSSIFTWVG